MFNVNQYNIILLFILFTLFTLLLLFLLRKKYNTFIDPLCNNIIWISSHIAFLLAFIYRNGLGILSTFFIFNILIYIGVFYLYPMPDRSSIIKQNVQDILLKKNKIIFLYFVTLIISIFTGTNFYRYILLNPNIESWFTYGFISLQGRDPFLRILSIGVSSYTSFFSFILIFIIKKFRVLVISIQLFMLIMGVLSGGRSSVLTFFFSLGMFLFYFDLTKKYNKYINFFGILGIIFALFIAVYVSSKYTQGNTLEDGVFIIVNRVAAASDGLEYYMKYGGYENIKSGPYEYFLSVFGVYVKNLFGIDYKNIGWQLTELAVGKVSFAQGSNYTFLLQIMIIGYYLFFIYTPLTAFIAMKLRYNTTRSFQWLPFSYFLCSTCFGFAGDLEYTMLVVISSFLFFILLIYPVLKVNYRL